MTSTTRGVLVLFLSLSTFAAVAQPRLVKDINTTFHEESSLPLGLGTIGNETFFLATQPETGRELWKTDGTESGTKIVRDIGPGNASGFVTNTAIGRVVGNHLVFELVDDSGISLWTTDGTESGTIPLPGLPPTLGPNAPVFGPVIGSTLYFAAYSPETGKELWRTDGTAAGTRQVVDLFPGPGSSLATPLARIGTRLLFSATPNGATGGWYITDGTAAGTQSVGISRDWSGGTPFGAEGALFRSKTADANWAVMRTDGTAAGTTVLRDGLSVLHGIFGGNGIAYFAAADDANGLELWKTDGTAAGTSLITDLTPGPTSSGITIYGVVNGRAVFATGGNQPKMWTSDGTAAGTVAVRDISFGRPGVVSGNHLYFLLDDGTHGYELWKSDGTATGTTLVADLAPGSASSLDPTIFPGSPSFTVRPGGVFFWARVGGTGFEPWITDGTAAGTRMIGNLAADTGVGSMPDRFGIAGNRLVFQAMSELWTSDGTSVGTVRVERAGITPGMAASSGGLYYFLNGSSVLRDDLWRSDGTAAGTFPLSVKAVVRNLTPFLGGLFFAGSEAPPHGEPWFTDGTVAGTRLLKDLNPNGQGYAGSNGVYVVDPGTLLFVTDQGVDRIELWQTDGTSGGTRRLSVLTFGWLMGPTGFVRHGATYFAIGRRDHETPALWRVDPVTGEFTAVRRFPPADEFNGTWHTGSAMLFFIGNELWRSDGTEAGTVRLAEELRPWCPGSSIVGDGVLYFYVLGFAGLELWRSDGTADGTFRLARRLPVQCGASIPTYSEGRLYFAGRDPLHGVEPWVTDGTAGSARMLADVNPGWASSDPASFLRIGRTLFFSAEEPGTGRELWAMETGCDGDCAPRRRRSRH